MVRHIRFVAHSDLQREPRIAGCGESCFICFTFTAPLQELTQRVEALRCAAWSQIVIPIVPGQESALEDWAKVKAAFG